MHIDEVSQAMVHAGFVALGVAFLAGLVFSFNPVALASFPVALAYVTKADTARQSMFSGAAFIAGMIVVQVALGFAAGFGGGWVATLIGRQWGLVLGPALIILGFVWAGWIRLPLSMPSFKIKRPTTLLGAFALGAIFAVAVCPVCNPEIIALLGAAGVIASPVFGAFLLLAFAIGRAIPIAGGAWAVGWAENLNGFAKHRRKAELLGAFTLIAFGLYMLNAYYFWVPALAI